MPSTLDMITRWAQILGFVRARNLVNVFTWAEPLVGSGSNAKSREKQPQRQEKNPR